MTEFYQTKLGRQFFEHQLPSLVKALQDLAATMKEPHLPPFPLGFFDSTDRTLKDFYNGFLQPGEESALNDPEYKELTGQIASMRESLQSDAIWERIEPYCQILVERNSIETEHAFEVGYRTATRLLIAGLLVPKEGEKGEV